MRQNSQSSCILYKLLFWSKKSKMSQIAGRIVLQNKQKEIEFFNHLAREQEYNVFTDDANKKIIDTVETLLKLPKGSQLFDLGCGSGVFSQLLWQRGYQVVGLDLSDQLLQRAKQQQPQINCICADVEALPLTSNSVDYLIFSCLLHHLPKRQHCFEEAYRVLKKGGRFVAFDPNRLNPFMYLYRDKSSPFYSSKGVTENERPVLPFQVKKECREVGLMANSLYLDGLSYRYVASSTAKGLLPIYNFLDKYCFKPFWMKPFRAFVFTYGYKI